MWLAAGRTRRDISATETAEKYAGFVTEPQQPVLQVALVLSIKIAESKLGT